LKQRGAVLVDPVELTPPHDYGEAELAVMLFELKADLEKYLATWAPVAAVKTLADVVAFNQQHRAEELPFFGQEYFERAVKKGPLTDLAYLAARDKVKKLAGANLEAVFAQQKLDAIVVMTAGPAWLIDLVNGDGSTLLSTTPAAAAGTPAITVPTAMERGLPMGLTFMGRAFSEATLLRLAAAYEAATHARRPPMLPPTVALPGLR
jgi:amidase